VVHLVRILFLVLLLPQVVAVAVQKQMVQTEDQAAVVAVGQVLPILVAPEIPLALLLAKVTTVAMEQPLMMEQVEAAVALVALVEMQQHPQKPQVMAAMELHLQYQVLLFITQAEVVVLYGLERLLVLYQ
jgi:hypothetical protein